MTLPAGLLKKIKLFFFAYLFLFFFLSITPSLVLASHDQKQVQQQNQIYGVDPLPSSEVVPIPPQTNPDQPTPKPEGDPQIQQEQEQEQGQVKGIISSAAKTAFEAIMNFIYFLLAGVGFGDTAQLNEKMDAYQRGVDDPSQIPHAGALDYVGFIASEALQLNVPVSSGEYFASINPFAQAQAQEGAQQLAGTGVIIEIWQRVRDVTYAFSAVVLIVIGFMIMVRWRLDPRTVVTIQNSLPRIVIALILVTFSFAISGLMIDITRLITNVIMSLVDVPNEAIIGLVTGIITLLGVGTIVTISAVPFVGPALLLIGLILLIIIFVVFFVLIYKLLTRYVIFLLLTIFAPLFFLGGALPGGEGLVLNWFKRQAAALLGIPMTALFVNLSFKIGFSGISGLGEFPSPWPVIGPLSSVLLFPPLIGFALFFFATKVPDIVDEMFGIKEMGARKGIGPGAIIGAPMSAASSLGNINRASQAFQKSGFLYGVRERFGNSRIGRAANRIMRFRSYTPSQAAPAVQGGTRFVRRQPGQVQQIIQRRAARRRAGPPPAPTPEGPPRQGDEEVERPPESD